MKAGKQRPADRVGPRQQHHWDWRAASNFIAGGAGGGLLFFAAAASLGGADVRALIAAGLALIAAGLTCVWFEIGRPWRALNVFRHIRTSWMTREASVAPLLFAAGGLAFALPGEGLPVLLTGVLGLAFLYSQARILAADKGIPAWRHRRCRPLLLATGLSEGAGFVALAAPWLLADAAGRLALILVGLLLVRAFLWRRYLAGLHADGAPEGSLRALAAIDGRFLIAGHLLPALLLGVVVSGAPAAAALVGAGALAVAGGWLLKYTLVRRAAFTQGFALRHLPVRGRGAAGPAARPGWGRAS